MTSQFDVQAFVEAEDLSVGKLQKLSKDELHEVAKYVHVEVSRSARKAKFTSGHSCEKATFRDGKNLSLPKLSWQNKKGSGLSLKKKSKNKKGSGLSLKTKTRKKRKGRKRI